MGRPKSTVPTSSEFAILQIMWGRSPMTVRDIQDELIKRKTIAYTSIATIVRIMLDKKYVEIFDQRRPQRFKVLLDREATTQAVLVHGIQDLFGGDANAAMKAVVMSMYDADPDKAIKAIKEQFKPSAGSGRLNYGTQTGRAKGPSSVS